MSTEQTESTPRQPDAPVGPPPAGSGGSAGSDGPPPQGGGPAEWGAPPPPAAPKSTWTTKKIVIAVVVAVGIAAAGGVAIYAASGSVDNSQGPGPGGGRMVFGGGPGMGMESSQHGEFQFGEITAISSDSVTVKSEDGFEQTYTMDSDTRKTDGLAKGDQVTVIATTENGTTKASSIMELGAMGGGPNGRRNGGTGGNGGNGGGPNGGNFGQPPSGGNN
jgi:hypothetical protein